MLYDYSIIPSRRFDLPVISIGNLSLGGTGKTPHTEYLVKLLQNYYRTATLSRGYGRKSSGFIIGDDEHSSEMIGDEPRQFLGKFRDLIVAVDEKRKRGIQKLMKIHPELEVILLDDAFQHRSVDAGLQIVLTDYHRLYTNDRIFPVGNLREPRSGIKRCEIIIITKTPTVLSPIERRMIADNIKPDKHQHLFFSYLSYSKARPLYEEHPISLEKAVSALLFEGIANPYPLEDHLRRAFNHLDVIHFRDHHEFSKKDIERVKNTYKDIVGKNKVIITTEKDAMRLDKDIYRELLKGLPVYYIPVEVCFHGDDEKDFNNLILEYVRESRRNA